jgi:hypothetical protein
MLSDFPRVDDIIPPFSASRFDGAPALLSPAESGVPGSLIKKAILLSDQCGSARAGSRSSAWSAVVAPDGLAGSVPDSSPHCDWSLKTPHHLASSIYYSFPSGIDTKRPTLNSLSGRCSRLMSADSRCFHARPSKRIQLMQLLHSKGNCCAPIGRLSATLKSHRGNPSFRLYGPSISRGGALRSTLPLAMQKEPEIFCAHFV